MGSDHILLVKSAWFREEYKRFYLRDIQAIVVAPSARFYVSTPMLVFALLWLLPGLAIAFWPSAIAIVWGVGTTAMAATWLAISIASSCRCRLYTAVSKDDLPSLYRTWTARKFLRQVRPRIEQVQGVVDAGWIEAERSNAGPAVAPLASGAPRPGAGARTHSLASDLFVLSLFVGSLVGFGTAHSASTAWFRATSILTLAQLAGAIAVLIECYRGRLGGPIRRVAIGALVLIGVTFYVQTFAFSLTSAVEVLSLKVTMTLPQPFLVARQVTDGLVLLLGFLGAAVILRGGFRPQPDIIKD
jgi:hypothetical protein